MTSDLACRILAAETALDRLELRALGAGPVVTIAADEALELVTQARHLVGVARGVHAVQALRAALPPSGAARA